MNSKSSEETPTQPKENEPQHSGLVVSDSDSPLTKGLKLSFLNLIEKLLSIWRLSYFGKYFPSLMAQNPSAVEKVRLSLVTPFKSALQEDVSCLIEERLSSPLTILNGQMAKHTHKRKPKAWRPSGDPDADIISPSMEVLQVHKKKLSDALTAQKQKTQKVLEQVLAGRKKLKENSLRIRDELKRMDKLNRAIDRIPIEELQNQMISVSLGHQKEL